MPDWPGSVVIQAVEQEEGSRFVLAEVRKLEFKSARGHSQTHLGESLSFA